MELLIKLLFFVGGCLPRGVSREHCADSGQPAQGHFVPDCYQVSYWMDSLTKLHQNFLSPGNFLNKLL